MQSESNALENHTLTTIVRELDVANDTIEELLGVRPKTFAYPCGQKFVGRGSKVQSYVPLVAERFLVGRGWYDSRPNIPEFCDLAQVMGMELDGLDWNQAKLLIEQSARKGRWLVLCGHDIGDSGYQTTRIQTLEAICEYAKDPANGLWIGTVEAVGSYIAEQRRQGQK